MMIRKDPAEDPGSILLAKSPSIQKDVVVDLVKEEFPEKLDHPTFLWGFIDMIQGLPLATCAELFRNKEALRIQIQNFQMNPPQDNFIQYEDEPIPWLQTIVWQEKIDSTSNSTRYVHLKTGEEISTKEFDQMRKGCDEVLWLPLSAHEAKLRTTMQNWIRYYQKDRASRQQKKPLLPWRRRTFMKHSYSLCKCDRNQDVSDMLLESKFGSLEWNLGCIADGRLRCHEKFGSVMSSIISLPFSFGVRYTIPSERFWELAIEASHEILSDQEKQQHDLQFYKNKYLELLNLWKAEIS
jgi:hypothetical protein